MKLIIGGAFQGKTQFAKTRFGLSKADIFRCDGTDIDFSRRCIAHLEAYTDACARENRDPAALFRENPDKWTETDQPGNPIKRSSTPAIPHFPNREHRFPRLRQ